MRWWTSNTEKKGKMKKKSGGRGACKNNKIKLIKTYKKRKKKKNYNQN